MKANSKSRRLHFCLWNVIPEAEENISDWVDKTTTAQKCSWAPQDAQQHPEKLKEKKFGAFQADTTNRQIGEQGRGWFLSSFQDSVLCDLAADCWWSWSVLNLCFCSLCVTGYMQERLEHL